MFLDNKQVLNYLPHRNPFLFIDSIESINVPDIKMTSWKGLEGAEVIACYRPDKNLEIFKGHFPDKPILPGVIHLEIMAQASSFVLYYLFKNKFNDISFLNRTDFFLSNIRSTKFRNPIIPEMDLTVKVKCNKCRNPFLNTLCKIYFKDVLMSESDLFLYVGLERI